MNGFELGAQRNEGLDEEFHTRIGQLRSELVDATGEDVRTTILHRIAELKQDYHEQSRRLTKIDRLAKIERAAEQAH